MINIQLQEQDLALTYCDKVCSSGARNQSNSFAVPRKQSLKDKDADNVYMTLLKVYLRAETAVRDLEKFTNRLAPLQHSVNRPDGGDHKGKGGVFKKISQIEGAEGGKFYNSADNSVDCCRSDNDDVSTNSVHEGQMLDEALSLLSLRWDRMNCAQALRMIPSNTTLQVLAGPL